VYESRKKNNFLLKKTRISSLITEIWVATLNGTFQLIQAAAKKSSLLTSQIQISCQYNCLKTYLRSREDQQNGKPTTGSSKQTIAQQAETKGSNTAAALSTSALRESTSCKPITIKTRLYYRYSLYQSTASEATKGISIQLALAKISATVPNLMKIV